VAHDGRDVNTSDDGDTQPCQNVKYVVRKQHVPLPAGSRETHAEYFWKFRCVMLDGETCLCDQVIGPPVHGDAQEDAETDSEGEMKRCADATSDLSPALDDRVLSADLMGLTVGTLDDGEMVVWINGGASVRQVEAAVVADVGDRHGLVYTRFFWFGSGLFGGLV